jgi:hypothetical protein
MAKQQPSSVAKKTKLIAERAVALPAKPPIRKRRTCRRHSLRSLVQISLCRGRVTGPLQGGSSQDFAVACNSSR